MAVVGIRNERPFPAEEDGATLNTEGGGDVKMNPDAKLLLVLAGALFFGPPLIFGVASGYLNNDPDSFDTGDMAAGVFLVACWFLAFVLFVVGWAIELFGSRSESSKEHPEADTDDWLKNWGTGHPPSQSPTDTPDRLSQEHDVDRG